MEGRCDDLGLDVGHLASRRKGLLRPAMDGADTARRDSTGGAAPGARAARVMNGADKRRFTKFIEAAELGGLELLRSRDPVFTLVSAGNFNTLHVVIRSSWRSDMMARARGCP